MSDSQIRQEIVRQHDELRELVGEIENLAKQSESSLEDADLSARLKARGRVLYGKFGTHLDREQELLGPLLLKRGTEGKRLADRLANEHDEQRELLDYLLMRLDQHPPTLLIARELQHFSEFLRGEMGHEEATLLSPEFLEKAGG